MKGSSLQIDRFILYIDLDQLYWNPTDYVLAKLVLKSRPVRTMTVLRRASLLAARPKNDYYDHNDLIGGGGL